jgi:hypothetical protein
MVEEFFLRRIRMWLLELELEKILMDVMKNNMLEAYAELQILC